MNTDQKFKQFLEEHLDAVTFVALFEVALFEVANNYYSFCLEMNLSIAATKKLSDNVLCLVEQFFASLSTEEVSEWICEGYTLITICADAKFLKYIIKYVSNINHKNCYSETTLEYECARSKSPNIEKIRILLENKIDVNAKSNRGTTALMSHCRHIERNNGNNTTEEIIELLIFAGADIFIKSNDNRQAYDYVINKALLSERSTQLLQSMIRLNSIKRAQAR